MAAQSKSVAERLGYPANSKLLIIHGDDLAVAHSVDDASFNALEKNAVTSASIMVPCPWLTEVADYAKSHPDADLGLHLTLTSEWKTYRWGPVAPSDQVPSLFGPDGMLWSDTTLVSQHAKAAEAELELRTQIERALAMGIRPTHLDTHMGSVLASPEIFAAYVKLAHEFHLPFLAVRIPGAEHLLSALSEKDIVLDALVMATPSVHPDKWNDFYLTAIKELKPGLTEMIVHLGHDDSELQAITAGHPDYGSAWRQRDYDFVTSPEFKKALKENHVIPVRWRDIGRLVQ
ncbi:MAG TPA: polysaccharide deacetylase family protein [Terriglobales bacterium]|nr:polysaccharide deacetylase family protein [Terriglobales bacterium]